jgi:hypothetical protein
VYSVVRVLKQITTEYTQNRKGTSHSRARIHWALQHEGNQPGSLRKKETPCISYARRPVSTKGIYLGKAAKCLAFFIENVEHGEEFRDRQQILDLLRQLEKLERAAFLVYGGETRYEFADTARIDIANTGKVQKDLAFTLAQKAAYRAAKSNTALADCNLTSPAWRSEIVISDIYFSSFKLIV